MLLKKEINAIWEAENVPTCHKDKFSELSQNLGAHVQIQLLEKEIKEFRIRQTPIQKLQSAIGAREECLK